MKTLVVIAALVILGTISLFFFRSKTNLTVVLPVLKDKAAKPSTSQFEFRKLTIPYLREKEYQSKLGELEKYSENSNYTAYLTSYISDGLQINGLLTVPEGEKPAGGWPAIIFLHGYIPPAQYKTTQNYADYVDFLAKNGFVVFKIDLRGHGASEGEAGGAYYSSDYIIDTLNAYSALQSSDFVNSQAIGLWGHSMAGNVVLRSMTAKPEIPAAVIWAGAVYTYTDLAKFGIQDASYQAPPSSAPRTNKRQLLRQIHGDPSSESAFWQQVAASNYLNDLEGAIQLNHAANDEVVNIGYSRDLNTLLEKTSVPHELHEYPSGGHNITGANFVTAMQNTVNFFKKYLKSI